MSRKFFGTDGMRGKANVAPIVSETVMQLARATALHLCKGNHRHKVVIGKDTRLSGYMLESALVSGFISMGMDVVLVGPMPTPAIAMLTRSLRADLGVMISASHNAYEDNGIKLFGSDGYKLSDNTEEEIESLMEQDLTDRLASSKNLGRAKRLEDEHGRYIEYIKNTFPKGMRLDGLKIVVDCANGAAYKVAPSILYELGAQVIAISVEPNGVNINDKCGALHTKNLQDAVIEHGADIGFALDGDADRLIICDEKGNIVDGDQIIGLIAESLAEAGDLKGSVVSTVMSNLGLERHLKNININFKRTPVGDRYIVDYMKNNNCNLGGEQSGHIILGDHSTTGDGLIAALQVLSVIISKGYKPASEICDVFKPVPQILMNVRYKNEISLNSEKMQRAIKTAEEKMGGRGRIIIRKSGTEPLIRIMAEGDNKELVKIVVTELCNFVELQDMQQGAVSNISDIEQEAILLKQKKHKKL